MTLYLREELFSFDHFDIWDASGDVIYTVDREGLLLGRTLHVIDAKGQNVAQVRHIPFSIPPTFSISTLTREVELVRNFTLFCHSYSIDALGWEISGDFTGHNYQLYRDDAQIASLEKEWLTLHDRYRLEVENAADALIALCVVLAIDCWNEMSR